MLRRSAFYRVPVNASTKKAEDTVNQATSKFKTELIKMLKMQLVLVPVGVLVLLWLYPPSSAEQERKNIEEYNRNAGWKT